jgi:hypothetical protein
VLTLILDAVSNYVEAKPGDSVAVVVKSISDTPVYIRLDCMDKQTGSGAYLLKVSN